MDEDFIKLVQRTAKVRGDSPVAKKFIQKALEQIDSGEIEAKKYPMGYPSLKDTYDIAITLQTKACTQIKE